MNTHRGSADEPSLLRQLKARCVFPFTRFSSYFYNGVSTEVRTSRQFVVSLLVICTFIVMTLLLMLYLVSVLVLHDFHLLSRVILFAIVFAYLLLAVIQLKRGHYTLVACLLILFYALLSLAMLWYWSINTPVGILLLGFVVSLVGITLGSRYILPIVGLLIAALFGIQAAFAGGLVHPNFIALAAPSTFRDACTYCVIFAIFAVVSWLSRRQMEQSFSDLQQAKSDLAKEKELLAVRLEEKTRDLREKQLEETRHLYRFAELGQLSTLLLHELANNLTVLTLDIDDLEKRHSRSKNIKRARESIGYLETMVEQVRHQLQDETVDETIDLAGLLREVIAGLRPKAQAAAVKVEYKKPKDENTPIGHGDSLRLAQVLTVIITNAIESYQTLPTIDRRVEVALAVIDGQYSIEVSDWGAGISKKQRGQLFEPFQSSKVTGMGIGLFIAKSMIESHFQGTLSLKDTVHPTTFVITLPKRITKVA